MKAPVTQLSPYVTYMLGNNLYIPITSRCNSQTLPETRGPNFLLPSHVVSSLLQVRDLECGRVSTTAETTRDSRTEHWNDQLDTCISLEEGKRASSSRIRLPPYTKIETQILRTPPWYCPDREQSQLRIQNLHNEIIHRIQQQQETNEIQALVISGEGEPTLRLDATLQLIQTLHETTTTYNHRVNNQLQQQHKPLPPIRLTTNGLIEDDTVPQRLVDGGVSRVAVALMTADPDQYDELMKPSLLGLSGVGTGLTERSHSRVCRFVQNALAVGLDVEITAVDRDDVEKDKLEELVRGTIGPCSIRWRPYFQ